MWCQERGRLQFVFSSTLSAFRHAEALWRGNAESEDVKRYRMVEEAFRNAKLDLDIARRELENHTRLHGCEPAN
jgi:hypothetical protein